MDKHIVIKKHALTTENEEAIKELLDALVLNTSHNGFCMDTKWTEFDDNVVVTVSHVAALVIGHDVLIANFYRNVRDLKNKYPELKGNIRVCDREPTDYHGWFSTTADYIRYNVARQEQYMLRECYSAQGARGHVGFCELKRITGIRVFGEPTLARKVLKRITKEAAEKSNFVDLRPGSVIMNMCGNSVMVLVEASNGHFQVINDGVPVSDEEVLLASSSPYRNVDYSFLYNHPLFQ